ncbi:hypothetical protein SCB71_16750 [Herbiconiux sp. KACC 21604]|uniref:hypothetical protein n=1 Tax=unclassified Herbiconiux TaxID=2618217 RepID=UPI001491B839|nr:hypothetical protein [Herbiconiux sp. SALV-R1]QJU54746.1 hypothetical protein HL652_14705 [Herbiconiux sp. SALV-R1]WPO85853.1 hypothetical protein SCB71_16750 [Herbiconiux sp. KACC 21604]
MTSRPFIALLAVSVLALAGCSSAPALTDDDAAALATLAEVAGPTSNVDPATITRTECWLPSEHLIDDPSVSSTTWKVLCRTHYVDDSGDRYQDATCVGDFALTPMLDHCYRWAFYTGMPHFEDFPGVEAGG